MDMYICMCMQESLRLLRVAHNRAIIYSADIEIALTKLEMIFRLPLRLSEIKYVNFIQILSSMSSSSPINSHFCLLYNLTFLLDLFLIPQTKRKCFIRVALAPTEGILGLVAKTCAAKREHALSEKISHILHVVEFLGFH